LRFGQLNGNFAAGNTAVPDNADDIIAKIVIFQLGCGDVDGDTPDRKTGICEMSDSLAGFVQDDPG
jgi:hypothetical protein